MATPAAPLEFTLALEEELREIIKVPAVYLDEDNVPYEYSTSCKFYGRRYGINVSCNMLDYLLSNDIPHNKFTEFASGCFINYANVSRIYA